MSNEDAVPLTDEQKSAAIAACALMIKGICLTTSNAEWTERIENRIHYLLCQITTAPTAEQAEGVRVLTADDADMVWPDYDSETFHHSIDEAVEYEVDQAEPVDGELELKVQLAKRIPTATIRIFNITESGHEWEIVAAPVSSAGGQEVQS